MRRRPTAGSRLLAAVGWAAAAGVVALGQAFAPRRRGEPLGPPTGHLAEGLPPLPGPPAPAGPSPAPPAPPTATPRPPHPPVAAAPPATPPSADPPPANRPAPASPRAAGAPADAGAKPGAGARRPRRLLADVEAAFAAAGRDSAGRRQRIAGLLPRPLAGMRMAAEPLIMPRLSLPRALAPDFKALRGLAARARPGEAVQVKLTAYCLTGTTRQGTPTRPGVVAADPKIFPLSRHVELYAGGRHLGRFRVEDTGGAVHGPHIDIWTPDCADARRFGTRPGVAALVGLGRD